MRPCYLDGQLYVYIYVCSPCIGLNRYPNFGFAELQHDPTLVDHPLPPRLSAVTICT